MLALFSQKNRVSRVLTDEGVVFNLELSYDARKIFD